MAGASASTERMFTRLLAYCGNAETMGFVPQNAHKLVAIPNGNRSILDLISRKVLVEVEGGGYRFPACIMGVREELPRGPAVPIDAWTIVRRIIPAEHSSATKTSLALEVSALLKQGTTETDVTAALEIWLGKPGLGPKVLPHLLSDVIRDRTAPPTSREAAAVIAHIALVHRRTAPRPANNEEAIALAKSWARVFSQHNLELPDLLAAVEKRAADEGIACTQVSLYARNYRPLQRAQIGRNVMTVLAFRSRGRHRTGVPALELIASRKPATVNAPVCGNCTSINLSAHTDPGFGDYFVCEDCMTQLDTDGGRI
ncbi:unnamed protein product, partial [Mesorhabditis spiculigera]